MALQREKHDELFNKRPWRVVAAGMVQEISKKQHFFGDTFYWTGCMGGRDARQAFKHKVVEEEASHREDLYERLPRAEGIYSRTGWIKQTLLRFHK